MNQSMAFINLFFIPLIAVKIYYKRHHLEFQFSLKLFIQYCMAAAANISLARIGVWTVKWLRGIDISYGAVHYTVIAVMAAVFMPFLYDLWKDYLVPKVGRIEKMRYGEKLFTVSCLVLLLEISYMLLGPLEIYYGNTQDFVFGIGDFIWQLIAIAALVWVAASILLAFLPDRYFQWLTVFLFWWGISSYVQYMFMNIKLSEIDGSPMNWESLGIFTAFNFYIWLLLLAVCVVIYLKSDKWFAAVKVISLVLCTVQAAAILSFVIMPRGQSDAESSFALRVSGDDQFKLASDDNIVVFIMDAFGNGFFEDMLTNHPEKKNILKDFTYYNNTDCHYYSSFPSISHFLTGSEADFGGDAREWLSSAWDSERTNAFYGYLHDAGYQCMLFVNNANTASTFGSADNLAGKFDNLEKAWMEVDSLSLTSLMLKYSAYRYVPYALKPNYEVLSSDFNSVISYSWNSEEALWQNYDFYESLLSEKLAVNEAVSKSFVVQYLVGAHSKYQTGKFGTYKAEASADECTQGLMVILNEYFEQMKNLGLYDDATIIVMADHGPWGVENDPQPIFLLKPSGASQEIMDVNSAPISLDDFQATIMSVIGIEDERFGTSIFDWQEDDERSRTLYKKVADTKVYYGYTYTTDKYEVIPRIENEEFDTTESQMIWQ